MIFKIDWKIISCLELEQLRKIGGLTLNCEIYVFDSKLIIDSVNLYTFSNDIALGDEKNTLNSFLLLRNLESDTYFPDIFNKLEFYNTVLKHIEGKYEGSFGLKVLEVGPSAKGIYDGEVLTKSYKFIKIIE